MTDSSSSISGTISSPIENSHVFSASENSNNENREKELQQSEDAQLVIPSVAQSESVLNSSEKSSSLETPSADAEISGDCSDELNKTVENVSSAQLATQIDGDDEYAKHISYNEQGVAIYTDPITKYQYKFDNDKNDWVSVTHDTTKDSEIKNKENPYENDHYRWCHSTKQWIPKETIDPTSTDNEFYKWDIDKNEWIPKTAQDVVVTSMQDGVYTYTDKDGVIFFWDDQKNAWFPKIDDDFMAQYQMSYGFIDNTSDKAKEDEIIENSGDNANNTNNTKSATVKRKPQQTQPQWFELDAEQNTKVYVSHLPTDITENEFIELMSKCGMIFRDAASQKLKVKLYSEPNGQLKGDGLCTYIRVESVQLALNLLDGYDVRGSKIKVQRAQFQMRGEYNPALKPKKKKTDKEKIKKMQEKLFDWRPEKMRGERSKHERIVIIKNLFTPELFEKEVHLIIDYQKDLRDECEKCGTVRKVVLFDRHPEGVAQINMGDPDEADLVVQMMNKRFFGKRQLVAEIWDGTTKYKIDETAAETDKRLSNWDKFLETNEQKEQRLSAEVASRKIE